jgi:NAD+ diphosphatase
MRPYANELDAGRGSARRSRTTRSSAGRSHEVACAEGAEAEEKRMGFIFGLAPASPARTSRTFVFVDGGVLLDVPEDAITDRIYLGRYDDCDCFAARAVSVPEQKPRSLRSLFMELEDETWRAIAGRGAQLTQFHETHRFCGRCGTETEASATEHGRRCPSCGLSVWPRVSPAVIVLVRRDETALLAQPSNRAVPFHSTLAGFVEPGETLEQCICREIREEVGIEVANPRYFGSQPWPFPHSLMIGFFADYAGGELRPDPAEIGDARWFTRDDLPVIPPRISIARRLIDAWLDER